MNVEFGAEKDEANRRKHGISLALAVAMNFDATLVIPDKRRDYGEARFRALAHRWSAACAGVHHARRDLRAVSLRKANPRERRFYERRHRQSGVDG